jgi:hypothetical protein
LMGQRALQQRLLRCGTVAAQRGRSRIGDEESSLRQHDQVRGRSLPKLLPFRRWLIEIAIGIAVRERVPRVRGQLVARVVAQCRPRSRGVRAALNHGRR